MAYFESKFVNVLLIFILCFSTATTSPQDDDFEDCMQTMKTYCNVNKPYTRKLEDPTSLDCVQVAIEHWQWNTDKPEEGAITPGILRQYYHSFDTKLELGGIPSPLDLCSQYKHKADLFSRCKSELELFGGNKDDAIRYALYVTRNKNYEIEMESKDKDKDENKMKVGFKFDSLKDYTSKKLFHSSSSKKNLCTPHFGLIYMLRLQSTIGVSDAKTPPTDFEFDKCIALMQKYCDSYVYGSFKLPRAYHCVRTAIAKWLLKEVPPVRDAEGRVTSVVPTGLVMNYYISFEKSLDIGSVPAPKEFCTKYLDKPDKYDKCIRDLIPFGESNESAVRHALYYTTSEGTTPKNELSMTQLENMEYIHFGLVYMGIMQILIKTTGLKDPRDICDGLRYPKAPTSTPSIPEPHLT